MAWTIEYDRAAQKVAQKLSAATQKRIRAFLEERLLSLSDPRQLGTSLKGSELGEYWRYRVGDYRIICDIQYRRLVVLVIDIGHRSDAYR